MDMVLLLRQGILNKAGVGIGKIHFVSIQSKCTHQYWKGLPISNSNISLTSSQILHMPSYYLG